MGSKSKNIIKRIKSQKMYQMYGHSLILNEIEMQIVAEYYKQQGKPLDIEKHLIK